MVAHTRSNDTHSLFYVRGKKALSVGGATSWIIKAVNVKRSRRTDGPTTKVVNWLLAIKEKSPASMQRLQFSNVFHFCDCMQLCCLFSLTLYEKYMQLQSGRRAQSCCSESSRMKELCFFYLIQEDIRHLPFLWKIRSGEHLIMFHLQERNFCCSN